jgi:hypothetical protein
MFKRKAGGSKYGAIKTKVGDFTFDSKVEAKFYTHLKGLQESGIIENLSLQPTFILMEGFRRNGVKIRDIVYKADFSYMMMDGRKIVVDVKGGDSTPEFKLKAKLLLKAIDEGKIENFIFQEVRWKQKQWEIIGR